MFWRARLDDPAECRLPAVIAGKSTWTYADLAARIEHYRSSLWSGPGPMVAISAEYSLESIAFLLALFELRRVVALVPRDGRSTEYLAQAGCSVRFDIPADGRVERTPISGAELHPLVRDLVSRGEGGCVIFTSGSSGSPKAALHSAARLFSRYRDTGRRWRTLAFLRFDHIAGLDTLMHALASGGTLVAIERRDPHSVGEALRASEVDVFPTSPSFLRLFLASGASGSDYPRLRTITYGSEPMDPTTLALLNSRFPGVRLLQKYGTTETGSPRTESRGPDSLWFRFRGEQPGDVEMDIRDSVLWLRGSGTLLGYLNAETPVDAAGWYCTGDVVERDGDWIRIRGRKSEQINVGGEKVSPNEVESTILELAEIGTAVVHGEANGLLGQIVVATVTPAPGVEMTGRELGGLVRRHCRARLAGFKVPVKVRLGENAGISARQKADRSLGGQGSRT